jgi:hypothetical protein
VTIESFRFDEKELERFLACEQGVYATDPIWQALPKRDASGQLSPDNPFFAEGEHRNFLAPGDPPAGRITAMTSPKLDQDGVKTGLVGFYECQDDAALAGELIQAALDWLAEQGAQRVLGPLNFSTWYRYRFVTEGFENGPFLLEPYNPPYYGAQFEAAGFQPFNDYASLRLRHEPVPLLQRAHDKALEAGITFSPLDGETAAQHLQLFYDMSRQIFAGKTAYSAISFEEFQTLYAGMQMIMAPGLSWLAHAPDGQPVGFLFAYPDLLEPLRTGDPGARPTATVLKTIAAAPGSSYLGWALTHQHAVAAREQGFEWGIYALMERYQELERYAERMTKRRGVDIGRVCKRYVLYARELG